MAPSSDKEDDRWLQQVAAHCFDLVVASLVKDKAAADSVPTPDFEDQDAYVPPSIALDRTEAENLVADG